LTRTALLVFPDADPDAAPAAEACAAAGWVCERATQPALALVRLIRPAAGAPQIGLLVVAAAAGGIGAAGLAKAVRIHADGGALAIVVVGEAAGLPPGCRVVPRGDRAAFAAALAGSRAGDDGLLDQEAIATLKALPGVWDRALAAYLPTQPRLLAEIEGAAGDLQALHRAAHALKGAAGSIGGRLLHQALARLDAAASDGDAATAALLVPAIRPLAERTLAALRGGPA